MVSLRLKNHSGYHIRVADRRLLLRWGLRRRLLDGVLKEVFQPTEFHSNTRISPAVALPDSVIKKLHARDFMEPEMIVLLTYDQGTSQNPGGRE